MQHRQMHKKISCIYYIDEFIDSKWFVKPKDPYEVVKYNTKCTGSITKQPKKISGRYLMEESGWLATPADLTRLKDVP